MQANPKTNYGQFVRHGSPHDFIGKPDPVSNLRPIKCSVPSAENEVEKLYRLERLRIHEWNDKFWRKHNETFKKEKEEFRQNCSSNGNASDELSKFYKDFLDRNWKRHCQYNLEWYKKNFYLSSLAFRVNISRLLRCCKKF